MNDDKPTGLALREPRPAEILDPELIDPELIEAPPLHLVLAKRPLSSETERLDVAAGLTIAELLRMADIPPWANALVYVDGDLIYPEFYHRVRPKPGHHVLVRIAPQGGGGGRGQGKNIGMLVAGILLIIVGVIMYLFPLTAPYAGIFVGAGVSLTLTSINNLLIPASTPAPRGRYA